MNLSKFLILCLIFTGIATSSHAQSYGTSLGLRMSNGSSIRSVGLTLQHRILKKVTLEGFLQSDFNNNTTFHGLIERHHAFLSKRFNLYVGAGFSFGTEESQFKDPINNEIITTFGNRTFGTDIILGIEATLLSYNISLDYKPNFNLVNRDPWYLGEVGVSFRSVIISGRKQNKHKRQRERAKKKREREKDEEPWLKDWFEGLKK